jgi:hypothetical protein
VFGKIAVFDYLLKNHLYPLSLDSLENVIDKSLPAFIAQIKLDFDDIQILNISSNVKFSRLPKRHLCICVGPTILYICVGPTIL